MMKELHIVGFQVGRETFGVPISQIYEIMRVPEITSVPDAPEAVVGVMNLRGKIVPVVDLRRRFGTKADAFTRRNRVVVAEVDGKLVGLLVDSASEVLKLPQSEIQPAASLFQDQELNYVSGVAKVNERLIILIDLVRVLERNELRRLTVPSQPAGATA
ncbi:MAG: purine-binding chemotaxis protein CheW [Acidobacteriaceae bacterium]|nr:purine-binding chemotaxis protein CheW [Acidobacteriaceae bacterium]